MNKFPQLKQSEYASLYLEETDKDLPLKINQNTRYAYFKTIARGGKSLIQSCRDLHLSRVVCYKSLLPEFAKDPIEQKRLLREARVSAMLQHPNTVPTYEIGRTSKGHYYFTMKLIHGYTLREILDYRERYDLIQLIDVIIQVAHALEYAHNHGVVHRDIKPENILVGPFGEVLLLDWGLAKVWSSTGEVTVVDDEEINLGSDNLSMTGFQKLQGTLCYMSPEQVKKDPEINLSTDVYSLGAILYEILCGQTPAQGTTADQLLASVLHDTPERPSSMVKGVPAFLEKTALKCLEKETGKRIESATELIRLLQENWDA